MTARKDVLVLAVEGNPNLQKIIAKYITAGGFGGVNIAGTIPDAWKILFSKDIGLVLCDIVIGKHSGLALLQRIRNSPDFSGLPVVVMSAKKDQRLIVAAARAGASGFLLKPFTEESLFSTLDKALTKAVSKAQSDEKKQASGCAQLVETGFKLLDEFDEAKAIAFFSKAIKTNPECADAYRGLAYACKARKEVDKFNQFMQTAAQVHIQNGDIAEAEKLFLEHRRHVAESPNPFIKCADALIEKKEFEGAARLFEHAALVEPGNPNAHLGSAKALTELGQKEAAQQKLKAALAVQDDNPEARKLWKSLTGERWTDNAESAKAKKQHEKEDDEKDRRETVRFWVPDLLFEIQGYEEHCAIIELSLRSAAFNPQEQAFEVGATLKAKMLHISDEGSKTILKNLTLEVARMDEEKVGCILGPLKTEQEEELSKILLAAQERQNDHYRERAKDITFDIDMLFV